MAIALIADAHLGGPGGPAGPLVEQLWALPGQGCSRLILLGDLCQIWVGDRRFETPEVRALTGALGHLREAGVRVDYIEGNRDFFLAAGDYGGCFDGVWREVAFEVGGRRFLAVHGDGLNARDWRYRFWRALAKSAASRWLMRRLPAALARRLVRGTERQLAATNFKHKRELPERVIRDYAVRRLAEGHDVLLLGHFHEPRRWRVEGGEVWLLDAWFRSRRVEWIGARDEGRGANGWQGEP